MDKMDEDSTSAHSTSAHSTLAHASPSRASVSMTPSRTLRSRAGQEEEGDMEAPPIFSNWKDLGQGGDMGEPPLPPPNTALPPQPEPEQPQNLRQPGTRLPLNFTPSPQLPRRGGPNPFLHLEHLLESFY